MPYKIKVKPEAYQDIQDGINWYNSQQRGLGIRFHKEIKQKYITIQHNPYFQVRYKHVHCLPLKKFPYMIHYVIKEKEKQIIVLGVISTHQNPKKWENRTRP
jgi:hypothetical protein